MRRHGKVVGDGKIKVMSMASNSENLEARYMFKMQSKKRQLHTTVRSTGSNRRNTRADRKLNCVWRSNERKKGAGSAWAEAAEKLDKSNLTH